MDALLAIAVLSLQVTVQDFPSTVDAYRAAIVASDRPALERMLHDDFVITAGDGQTRDKTGELADLVGESLTVHEFRLDEARYRTIGDTGIATGILRWRMTYRGRESSIERHTTMTWVREASAWRMVAQHVSRVK